MNDLEQEVIVLNTAWGMIDSMVNWSIFVRPPNLPPTNLMFESDENSRLFVILLGDFLSQVASKRKTHALVLSQPPSNAKSSDLTFLYHLRQVAIRPRLGADASTLSASIEKFSSWLERILLIKDVHLSSINVVATLNTTAYRYLKMCGDIAKHNLARLTVNVGYLQNLLKAASYDASEQEACMAMDDFFEKFHTDVFIYQSSYIAELLNDIRLQIFDYLAPEYERSWYRIDNDLHDRCYGFKTPSDIEQPIARAMYWDLMNRVRKKPIMGKFVVPEVLKQRY